MDQPVAQSERQHMVSIFDDEVRASLNGINLAGLNWKRFFLEMWPVSVAVVTHQDEIRQLFLPWYFTDTSVDARFNDPDAHPYRVGDALDRWQVLSATRRSLIDRYRLVLSSRLTSKVVVPVYLLRDGDRLLLDGCHRACALALLSQRPPVQLLLIGGPFERSALADLVHWGA
jgi:hypothetical protein